MPSCLADFRSVFLWCTIFFCWTCFDPVSVWSQDNQRDAIEGESVLDPALVSNRLASQILDRVKSDLNNGELIRGLAGLQRILDFPSDYFFIDSEQNRVASLRSEASRLLASLDAAAFSAYERQVEAESVRLLKEADRNSDPHQLFEIVRRYFHTAGGVQASDRLLTAALDRRDFRSAFDIADAVFQDSRIRQRVTPAIAAKAVLAASYLGDKEAARRFSRSFRGDKVQIGGQAVSLTGFSSSLSVIDGRPRREEDWKVVFGNRERNSETIASIPLMKPVWSESIAVGSKSEFSRELDGWVDQTENNLRPLAVANQAVTVGGQIVYRNSDGVRAFGVHDGSVLWEYRERTSLAEQLRFATQPNGFRRQRRQSLGLDAIYAANSIRGHLAGDNYRVYFVEDRTFDGREKKSDPRVNLAVPSNHVLIALPLAGSGPDESKSIHPSWAISREDVAPEAEPTTSFRFLGPPLPVDGQLFACVEVEGLVSVLAIAPTTGEILWRQPLVFHDRPESLLQTREDFSATPLAMSGTTLVCPTDSNLWIGLDTFRGQLKWAYSVADQRKLPGPNRHRGSTIGDPTFPAMPHIADGRVYFLSPRTHFVHCVDLETGQQIWRTPRQDNDFYVATVSDQAVVLVGRQLCRGLAVETGEEIWSVRYGTPSGTGFRSGNQYLLPLQKGAIAAIDIATGEERGSVQISQPRESKQSPPPGNLIPVGDYVASVNFAGLTIFPQTKPLLAETRETLQANPEHVEHRLLVAELELLTGNFPRAIQVFEPLRSLEDLSGEELQRRNSIWRKLLTWELAQKPEQGKEILSQLEKLADHPAEQAKFLVQKAEFLLKSRDVDGVLQTAAELAATDSQEPLLIRADGTHWLSPSTYAQDLMHRLGQTVDSEMVWANVDVEGQQQSALESGQAGRLRQFLTLFGDRPQADAVRGALAELEHTSGQFNAAELLWLRNQESENLVVAATATVHLIDMYRERGLFYEANRQLSRLRTSPMDLELATGESVADVTRRLRQSPVLEATRKMTEATEPVDSVRIRSSHWVTNLESLTKSFGRYRTRFLLPSEMSFHLVDHNVNSTGVAAIDQQTGFIAGHLPIPRRNSFPSQSKLTQPGHFLPIGGPGEMLGASLLELQRGEPLWKGSSQLHIPSVYVPRVGPYGLDYCVFQSQRAIHCIDPVTGEMQWERELDDPESGLKNDPDGGIVGDADVLVVFGADRRSYKVLQTRTGREIRRGVLDFDVNQVRRSFGRKFFYVASTPTGRRMRIWDPLSNRYLLDEPVVGRVFSAVTPERELAIVLPDKTDKDQKSFLLRILDVEQDRIRTEVPLSVSDLQRVNYLRVFRQSGRYYVNLHQPFQQALGGWFSYYASDTFLPEESVLGELIAIDPDANRILWRREVPQRSILELPFFRLPFLVMISRVRDRQSNRRQALLVEILDRETGQTLAIADNILPDRIVHAEYDPESRQVILQGLRTQVTIDFSDNRLFKEGVPL